MRKKVLLVVSVAILTMVYAQAQIDFGVRAGLNLTNIKYSGGGFSMSPDMKPGFQLGVVGEISVIESFVIQPGIIFAQQGYKLDKWKTSLNYIQIPVNAMYKVDLGCANLLLQAGPYFGFGISGKTKYDGEGSDKIKFGSGDDADIKVLDLGLGIGAGFQFGAIQAGIGHNFGLMNIDPENSSDYKVKNNGLAITLTYFFGK